jgi:hypothetical protein
MSEEVASAISGGTEPSNPTGQTLPTGYRVCVVPGALDIAARLGTPEEVRNLVKVLRAGILILSEATESDTDIPESLAYRLAATRAASQK